MSALDIRQIQISGHEDAVGVNVNLYRVRIGGETVLIDSGYDNDETHEKLAGALEADETVGRILFTHVHPDHLGGALHLQRQSPDRKIPWAAHTHETKVNHRFEAVAIDQPLDGVDSIEVGGETLEAIHTPGHTPGHICFFHRPTGALFSGDLIVGEGTVWVGPPNGDLADYMESLHRVRDLPLKRIYPGHGPVVDDPIAKVDEYIEHRMMRERQVLALLGEGVGAVQSMVERIYFEVDKKLWPVAGLTVLGHLTKLQREGRVTTEGGGWRLA